MKNVMFLLSGLCLFFLMQLSLYAGEIYDLTPQMEEQEGYFLPMSLELIPGCGFLYMDEYGKAAVFSSLKLSGLAFSAYYFYRSFDSGYDGKTEARYRENFTISAAFTAGIYAVSWVILYRDITRLNEKSLPLFEIGFTDAGGFLTPVFYSGMSCRF